MRQSPRFLREVPEDELTESLCRIIFYPHVDDDTWEDYIRMLGPGDYIQSEKYGIRVTRDEAGVLHYPLFD